MVALSPVLSPTSSPFAPGGIPWTWFISLPGLGLSVGTVTRAQLCLPCSDAAGLCTSARMLPTPGLPSAHPWHRTAPDLLLLAALPWCCFSLCCGWEAGLGKGEDRQGKAAGTKIQREQVTMGDPGFHQKSH